MKVQVKYPATKRVKEMEERYAVILAKLGKVEILAEKKKGKKGGKTAETVQEKPPADTQPEEKEHFSDEKIFEEAPEDSAQENLDSLA